MDLINSILGKKALQILNVSRLRPELEKIAVANVRIKWSSTPMKHVKEDGSLFIDCRVINPCRMSMDVFTRNLEELSAVNAMFSDRSSIYQIQTRGIMLPNMKIESMSIKQAPEVMSASPIRIEFKQLLVENFRPVIFKAASDSSIIDRGIAAVTELKDNVGKIFDNVQNAASDIGSRITGA